MNSFQDSFAAEWTPDRLEAFQTVVKNALGDRQSAIDAFQALSQADRDWMASTVLQGAVSLCGGNAYAVPVLSPAMCQQLVQWGDAQLWTENEAEEADYRMEEIVIAHHEEAYDEHVKTLLMYGLAPYFAAIFGKLPDEWNSVQFTRYSAGQRAGGNYHTDATSKYTAVISLNQGEFEGGGTRMVSGVFGSIVVPPLPTGWALIFRGREIFHKGEPITSGTRKLLTIWTDDHDCSHD